MCKKKIGVGVGIGVGSVDIVDGHQTIELHGFVSHRLCGGRWGLTLGNPCMQSPQVVVI